MATPSRAIFLIFWAEVLEELQKAVSVQQLAMHATPGGECPSWATITTCDECCKACWQRR